MLSEPLSALGEYSRFVATTLADPIVRRSTVQVWSTSPYTGVAEGEIVFDADLKLRIREELDFEDGLITSYGYEVDRGAERLYWYDDFPHPEDPSLAATFPHHKHVPPNIRRNRVPAPQLSSTRPNLPVLLDELRALLEGAETELEPG